MNTHTLSDSYSKYIRHALLILAVLAAVLLISQEQCCAASGARAAGKVDASGGVNLRASASTSSDVKAVIPDNTGVTIIREVFKSKTSTSKSKKWYYVSVNGTKGYIRSDFVDSISYSKVKGKVTEALNARKGPGTGMKIIDTIPAGKTVSVYIDARPKSSVNGGSKTWYRIKYKGKKCYVSAAYVDITGQASSASAGSKEASSSGEGSSSGESSDAASASEDTSSAADNAAASSGDSDSTSAQASAAQNSDLESQAAEVAEIVTNAFSVMTDKQFNSYLKKQGFPKAYRKKLKALHKIHPNWIFKAYKTDIKWSYALKRQTRKGASLVYGSYPKSYRSGGNQVEPGWYNASKKVVAYYMDPRNFLNEERIYMFEELAYESEYQTPSAVSRIISGTKLASYGFTTEVFMNAGKKYNISPVFLAARVRQETGGSSASVNGSKSGGTVVYNPFNIGAYGGNPVRRGLAYAKKHGWTTPAAAVEGGAEYLASGYISKKQNSVYFQRFNVANGKLFVGVHQYMTNIMAPYSEAHITKTSYEKLGITNEPLAFVIPVYTDMPSKTQLPK